MSLLLDALKQAEKNKVTAQHGAKTPLDDESPAILESISTPELNEIDLTELEISPEFDLTIYPVDSMLGSNIELDKANTGTENLSLGPRSIETKQADEPENLHQPADTFLGTGVYSTKLESVDDGISDNKAATEKEGGLGRNKYESNATGQKEAAAVTRFFRSEELNPQVEASSEMAESLFSISTASNKNSKIVIILTLLAVVAAVAYFYLISLSQSANFSAVTQPVESTSAEIEPEPDSDMTDQVLAAPAEEEQTDLSISVMAKPVRHEKTPSLPVESSSVFEPNSVNTNEPFSIEPESQAIAYPEAIRVSVKRMQPKVVLYLNEAYRAYQSQDFASASMFYRQAIRHQPSNIDALLGLGAIAEHQGDKARAKIYFEKVLTVDGNNTFARTALIRLQHSRFPSDHESLYKTLIEKGLADAGTYSSLGDLYASEQRWHEAQAAYFDAVKLLPQQADYNYNLAVSLDHVGKTDVALRYYRQALTLAINEPSKFNLNLVEERIRQLQ